MQFQNPEFYTGVGSRKVPTFIFDHLTRFAIELRMCGMMARSGGADGCDTAIEVGASTRIEVYTPYKGFNGRFSQWPRPTQDAMDLAHEFIPHWDYLKPSDRLNHARNLHQVLGYDLNTPSSFVLCYTPGGRAVGGTATAIRVAKSYCIPVYNFGDTTPYDIALILAANVPNFDIHRLGVKKLSTERLDFI